MKAFDEDAFAQPHWSLEGQSGSGGEHIQQPKSDVPRVASQSLPLRSSDIVLVKITLNGSTVDSSGHFTLKCYPSTSVHDIKMQALSKVRQKRTSVSSPSHVPVPSNVDPTDWVFANPESSGKSDRDLHMPEYVPFLDHFAGSLSSSVGKMKVLNVILRKRGEHDIEMERERKASVISALQERATTGMTKDTSKSRSGALAARGRAVKEPSNSESASSDASDISSDNTDDDSTDDEEYNPRRIAKKRTRRQKQRPSDSDRYSHSLSHSQKKHDLLDQQPVLVSIGVCQSQGDAPTGYIGIQITPATSVATVKEKVLTQILQRQLLKVVEDMTDIDLSDFFFFQPTDSSSKQDKMIYKTDKRIQTPQLVSFVDVFSMTLGSEVPEDVPPSVFAHLEQEPAKTPAMFVSITLRNSAERRKQSEAEVVAATIRKKEEKGTVMVKIGLQPNRLSNDVSGFFTVLVAISESVMDVKKACLAKIIAKRLNTGGVDFRPEAFFFWQKAATQDKKARAAEPTITDEPLQNLEYVRFLEHFKQPRSDQTGRKFPFEVFLSRRGPDRSGAGRARAGTAPAKTPAGTHIVRVYLQETMDAERDQKKENKKKDKDKDKDKEKTISSRSQQFVTLKCDSETSVLAFKTKAIEKFNSSGTTCSISEYIMHRTDAGRRLSDVALKAPNIVSFCSHFRLPLVATGAAEPLSVQITKREEFLQAVGDQRVPTGKPTTTLVRVLVKENAESAASGGFLTLKCRPDTTVLALKEQALAQLHSRRRSTTGDSESVEDELSFYSVCGMDTGKPFLPESSYVAEHFSSYLLEKKLQQDTGMADEVGQAAASSAEILQVYLLHQPPRVSSPGHDSQGLSASERQIQSLQKAQALALQDTWVVSQDSIVEMARGGLFTAYIYHKRHTIAKGIYMYYSPIEALGRLGGLFFHWVDIEEGDEFLPPKHRMKKHAEKLAIARHSKAENPNAVPDGCIYLHEVRELYFGRHWWYGVYGNKVRKPEKANYDPTLPENDLCFSIEWEPAGGPLCILHLEGYTVSQVYSWLRAIHTVLTGTGNKMCNVYYSPQVNTDKNDGYKEIDTSRFTQ